VARSIRWTEAAILDLSEAADFIARDSPFYATALVREARVAARSLKSLADRGRVVPEIQTADVRELFVKSYRLIYKITPDNILVIAFVHGARDLLRFDPRT
jgi:plasmid stabilization system protein ParE